MIAFIFKRTFQWYNFYVKYLLFSWLKLIVKVYLKIHICPIIRYRGSIKVPCITHHTWPRRDNICPEHVLSHKTSILLIKQNPTKGSFNLSILTCSLATSSTNISRQILISFRPSTMLVTYPHVSFED
jgi:hypothetical protein